MNQTKRQANHRTPLNARIGRIHSSFKKFKEAINLSGGSSDLDKKTY